MRCKVCDISACREMANDKWTKGDNAKHPWEKIYFCPLHDDRIIIALWDSLLEVKGAPE